MKNRFLILSAFLFLGLMSCDLGQDPDIGGTATQPLAGEYYLQLFSAPGGDLYVDYTLWTISNTAANTADKVRVSDNENVWGFNCAFNANVSNKTFSGESAQNAMFDLMEPATSPYQPIGYTEDVATDYPQFMTITEGSIVAGATVPSASPTDSISFYATAFYNTSTFEVIGYSYDTTSMDPLMIDTLSVFAFVKDTLEADGPYFLSGYQRTGFLEDEH